MYREIMEENKVYIIWGNFEDTPDLIEKLKKKDDGIIAVIDQQVNELQAYKDYVLTTDEFEFYGRRYPLQ